MWHQSVIESWAFETDALFVQVLKGQNAWHVIVEDCPDASYATLEEAKEKAIALGEEVLAKKIKVLEERIMKVILGV